MGLDREASPDSHAVVGRYALYDKIAAGGMATVHFGRLLGPIGFSRTVAIKRMLPQFVSDPGFVSMFVDEARLASRIRHPNVIPTLDVRAALAAVAGGDVPAGIVYRTDAAISKDVEVVYTVTDGPKITYSVAPISASKNPTEAAKFVAFLDSPAGRAIFEKRGFLVRTTP